MPTPEQIKRQNQLLSKQQDILQSIQNTIVGATASANQLSSAMGKAVSYATQLGGDMGETARNTNQAADHAQELGSNLRHAADSGIEAMKRFGSSMGGHMKEAGSVAFSTVTQTMGAIGEVTQSMFSFKFMAAFSALFTLILSHWEKTTAELRSQLGIVFTDPQVNNNLNEFFRNFESQIITSGLTFQEVVGTAQVFSSEFGVGVSKSGQLAFNIADGAKALGTTSQVMTNIVGGFSLAYDISHDQAHTLSEQVGLLSAMNDVAPGQILQDISESTEDMAKYSKGGLENFVKSAIHARKLGMSIKDVSNTMSGLLNFEDSLNKEMQASIMLGKRINLHEARRRAYAGDTAGAMESIKEQLDGIDMGELSPLQLQAVAEAANMNVQQVMKLAKGTADMDNIQEDSMGSFNTNLLTAKNTLTELEELQASFTGQMRSTAAKEGATYFETIEKTFTRIMETGFFENAAGFLGDVQKGIGSIFGIIFNKDLEWEIGKDFFKWEEKEVEKEINGKLEKIIEKGKPMTKGAAIVDMAKNLGRQFLGLALQFFKIKKKGTDVIMTVDEAIQSFKDFFKFDPDKNMFENIWDLVKKGWNKLKEILGIKPGQGLLSGLFFGKGGGVGNIIDGEAKSQIATSIKQIGDTTVKQIEEEGLGNILKTAIGDDLFTATGGEKKGGGAFTGLFSGWFSGIDWNVVFSGESWEKLKVKLKEIADKIFPSPKSMMEKVANTDFTSLTQKTKENIAKMKDKAGAGYRSGMDFLKTLFGFDENAIAQDLATQMKIGFKQLENDTEFKDAFYKALGLEQTKGGLADSLVLKMNQAMDKLEGKDGALGRLKEWFGNLLQDLIATIASIEFKKDKEKSTFLKPVYGVSFSDNRFAPDPAGDFISRPGQPVQRFSSDDTVMGLKSGPLGGLSDNQNKTNTLLEENNRLMNRLLNEGIAVRRA